jgi:hypothetical protein
MKRPAAHCDLSPLDDTPHHLFFYDGRMFGFHNAAMTAETGLTTASANNGQWVARIAQEDRPRVLRALGEALLEPGGHVVDVRWLRIHEHLHHWRRWFIRPVFDPRDHSFITHVVVGKEISSDVARWSAADDPDFNQLQLTVQELDLAERLIHRRAADDTMNTIFEGNPVAFAPKNEKVKDYAYRIAMVHPDREGYQLVGHWPFLPTKNYVAPWFQGNSYSDAVSACLQYNLSHGHTRESVLKILQAAKCLAFID